MSDQIDLSRFTDAQEKYYQNALLEVKEGRKRSHWMWYIFPQIQGLGKSFTSQYYAIQSADEARAFLNDPYLGKNLIELAQVLCSLDGNDPVSIFGYTDAMKLRSSMTLFACVSEKHSIFSKVLEKYYNGKYDNRTRNILDMLSQVKSSSG